MQNIPHYIGGERCEGQSGRFGDVYNPALGRVAARVPLAGPDEVQAAVAAARKAFPAWAETSPLKRARVMFVQGTAGAEPAALGGADFQRARQGGVRRHWRSHSWAGGGGIRLRHSAVAEGRVHRTGGRRHRQPFHASAAGRGGRHHPFNFPAMVPLWMFPVALAAATASSSPSERDPPPRCCWLNCCSRPACRPAYSMWCTATSRRWTPCSPIPTSPRSASSAPRRLPSTSMKPARATASGCRRWAAPRTTWW